MSTDIIKFRAKSVRKFEQSFSKPGLDGFLESDRITQEYVGYRIQNGDINVIADSLSADGIATGITIIRAVDMIDASNIGSTDYNFS